MLVSLAERSLSTRTVDGVLTGVEPSPARTSPRSTDRRRTSPVGSPSRWLTPSSHVVRSSSSHTPSVLRSHFPSTLTPTVPLTSPLLSSSRSSMPTSTSALVSLSRSLIWPAPSTSRLRRTVTSPTRTSAGRSPRLSSSRNPSLPYTFDKNMVDDSTSSTTTRFDV